MAVQIKVDADNFSKRAFFSVLPRVEVVPNNTERSTERKPRLTHTFPQLLQANS